MTTPPDTDPFAFDEHLRALYAADETPTPAATMPAHIWQGVQPQLRPVAPMPVPAARRLPLLAGAGGLMLGILLMWGLHWGWQPANLPINTRHAVGTPTNLPIAARHAVGTPTNLPIATRHAVGTPTNLPTGIRHAVGTPTNLPTGIRHAVGTPTNLPTGIRHAVGTPTNFPLALPAVPAVLAGLVLTETTFAAVPPDSAQPFRERRRAALLVQRAELIRLRWRTDSLLLGLGERPAVLANTDSLPPSNPLTLPASRWSVALAFAPERNFFGLSSPANDTLSALRRTHETGRAGYNAAVLAEYRLTDRWSVGAGVGVSSYGAELRLTEHRTVVKTDTIVSLVESTRDTITTGITYSVQVVDELRLTPRVNFNNQLIGYDSVYVQRNDTVWTYLTNTTVVKTIDRNTTPHVTTHDEVQPRLLRPTYHFLTLPVQVSYRLGRATDWTASPTAPRWWADVTLGAQLQWFMGGTQVVTRDGRSYTTARIGRNNGPFRPFSYALTTSLAFNYAMTSQLSASVAPTVRYQVESIYKPATHLTQRPLATGVQLGLRYAF